LAFNFFCKFIIQEQQKNEKFLIVPPIYLVVEMNYMKDDSACYLLVKQKCCHLSINLNIPTDFNHNFIAVL